MMAEEVAVLQKDFAVKEETLQQEVEELENPAKLTIYTQPSTLR